jgi:hypothetical protein
MNTWSKFAALTAISMAISSAGLAQVTFEFHTGSALGVTGSALDNASGQATSTVGGITLTAEAFLDGVSTSNILNGASDSFGVNDSGADDQTQRLDNHNGIESIVFSFDTAGTFTSINLRFIESSGTQEGELVFDGGNTIQLNSVTATGSSDIATIGESFTAGQSITLRVHSSAVADTNFSLEGITISAVPEPSSFVALAGLMMLGFAGSRRRVRAIAA